MPNMSLLVPGTGGITLRDNRGNDLGYPVKMQIGVATSGMVGGLSAPDLVELLSMEHRPGQVAPVKTSLKPGTSVVPGHVLRVAYNQIPDAWNVLLYDWRADIRYSAQQLVDFITERSPADGKWNLVGHSQGGLLIIVASKLMNDAAAFGDLVNSVTLVGAPVAGTVNSASALLNGNQMGPKGTASFQKIMRTWPALFQMLPAWPAVVESNGIPAPADRQLTALSGWAGIDGISEDMLDRTAAVQAMLRDPFALMGTAKVSVLLGRNRDTAVTIPAATPVSTKGARNQKGDTLVPHDQTLAWMGGHFAQYVRTYPSPCNAHAMLCDDPGIATQVRFLCT
jgi:pimeloyl-ACP methyl ester carboxylesterase